MGSFITPLRTRCALAGLLLAAAGAAAQPEACRLQQLKMPLQTVAHRPVASLQLNGTEVQLLVDSGAFFSMLSPATAAQLNLPLRPLPHGLRIEGLTGEIEAQRTVVDKLGLLGATLPKVEFLVGGNELGSGIDGILGRNILSVADTEYDLAHGQVMLSFPTGRCEDAHYPHWAGEAPVVEVPLLTRQRGATGPLRVVVKVNGVKMVALLDTGAPTTSMTLRAARRAGIEPAQMRAAGYTGGAGAGRARAWTARVDTLEIATQRLNDNQLHITETESADHEMLIGLDYFLAHRIYVSQQERKLYITWNGTPVFPSASGQDGVLDTRQAALPAPPDLNDADALARRGAASLAAGKPDLALEDLDRAIALAPEVAEAYFTRARIQAARRQADAVRADLDAALRLNPALDEARLWRARYQAARRDGREAAVEDLAMLDNRLLPHSHLRLEMAQHNVLLRRTDEALRQYALWIDTHPQDARLPQALHERCLLRLRENRDLPLAVQDCERAADNDSALPVHREHVGYAHLRAGDERTALRRFERAARQQATATALYGRGLAHERLGNGEDAARDLQRARELEPRIEHRLRLTGLLAQPAAPAAPDASATAPGAEALSAPR